jgi:hypothetical protein
MADDFPRTARKKVSRIDRVIAEREAGSAWDRKATGGSLNNSKPLKSASQCIGCFKPEKPH